MNVVLMHYTPIIVAVTAIRQCYNSIGKSDTHKNTLGEKDKKLIENIIKNGHTSTLEHINYNLWIKGISRALLQELSRHRVGISLSVKSTRYTLKEINNINDKDISKYFYLPCTNDELKELIVKNSKNSIDNIKEGYKNSNDNDIMKYMIPENYKTDLIMTCNARSLMHLFELRTSDKALEEFRMLCKNIYDKLPDSHKFMFEKFFVNYEEKND